MVARSKVNKVPAPAKPVKPSTSPNIVKKSPAPNLRKKPVSKVAKLTKPPAKLTAGAQNYYSTLKGGKPLVVRKVFDGRSSRINTSANANVSDLGKALSAFPASSKFVFEGHVDATANNSGDFWVSAQQTGKLRDEVIRQNPSLKDRIEISAKGGKSPLVPNIKQTQPSTKPPH